MVNDQRPRFVSSAPYGAVLQGLLVANALSIVGVLSTAHAAVSAREDDLAARTSELALGPASMVWAGTTLALALAFPLWFYRAYKNLVAFHGKSGVRSSPLWAFFVFWVPFVNIWRPHAIAQELYAKSGDPDELLATSRDASGWWVGWLLAGIALKYSETLATLLCVASAVFAIRMVRSVVARQAARAAQPLPQETISAALAV